jgi:hypothetical protein
VRLASAALFVILASIGARAELPGPASTSAPLRPLPVTLPLAKETCAAPCVMRNKDGTCGATGSEVCGLGYVCVPHCIQRNADSTCSVYLADYCGSGASCEPRCISRTADGKCAVYGSDGCASRL